MSRILALTRVLRGVHVAPPSRSSGGAGFAGAAILLHQVHARQRHVQLRVARVFEQHEVALLLALHDLAQSQKLPDAVRDVDHEVARLQIRQVGRERRQAALLVMPGRAIRSDGSNRSSEPMNAIVRLGKNRRRGARGP